MNFIKNCITWLLPKLRRTFKFFLWVFVRLFLLVYYLFPSKLTIIDLFMITWDVVLWLCCLVKLYFEPFGNFFKNIVSLLANILFPDFVDLNLYDLGFDFDFDLNLNLKSPSGLDFESAIDYHFYVQVGIMIFYVIYVVTYIIYHSIDLFFDHLYWILIFDVWVPDPRDPKFWILVWLFIRYILWPILLYDFKRKNPDHPVFKEEEEEEEQEQKKKK